MGQKRGIYAFSVREESERRVTGSDCSVRKIHSEATRPKRRPRKNVAKRRVQDTPTMAAEGQ